MHIHAAIVAVPYSSSPNLTSTAKPIINDASIRPHGTYIANHIPTAIALRNCGPISKDDILSEYHVISRITPIITRVRVSSRTITRKKSYNKNLRPTKRVCILKREDARDNGRKIHARRL